MKTDQNMTSGRARGMTRKARVFCMLYAVTVAGLVCMVAYNRQLKLLEKAESAALITDRLAEMSESSFLIRDMGTGGVEAARQDLNLQLLAQIERVHASEPWMDKYEKNWAESLCNRIMLNEKQHPEYYLSPAPNERMAEIAAWKALENRDITSNVLTQMPL
jgi:hypothetical protein